MAPERDSNTGTGTELLSHLAFLAKKQGLFGLRAGILVDNKPMHLLMQKMGAPVEQRIEAGVVEIKILFKEK